MTTDRAESRRGRAFPSGPRGPLIRGGWVVIWGLVALLTPAVLAERPNVVLVMTDNQGYGDLGFTGNPVVETPRIDAMARRSARMSRFYVQPVCSPTRACLMTGRYNYRTRVVDTFLGRALMEPKEVTVAEALAAAGYATGIFGKWHLGDNYPMRPQDQGFGTTLVLRGGGFDQPAEPPENNGRYTDPILFRNGEKVRTEGYCTDVFFREGIAWMKEAVQADRPFFLYLPTNTVHRPWDDVPEALYRKYKNKDLTPVLPDDLPDGRVAEAADNVARIYAMVENIDRNMGRLFEALKAAGVYENTLVIFMMDNGPNTRRYTGRFRGKMLQVYEGGIRSVFFAHWPAALDAGETSDRIAAHIDVMPTILDACGVRPPDGVALDGRSLLPLLEGKPVDWPERTLFIQSHRGDRPVRYHNMAAIGPRWKLLRSSGFRRKTPPEGEPSFELYDIPNDPGETEDLSEERPEVVDRLRKRYDRWFEDVSSTRPNNYTPPRIYIGTEHEHPVTLTRQDWQNVRGKTGPRSIGYWRLHVAQGRAYDIRLRFPSRGSRGTAELRIAGRTLEKSYAASATSVTFSDVRLDTGNVRLHPVLHEGKKKRGAYQVDVMWK